MVPSSFTPLSRNPIQSSPGRCFGRPEDLQPTGHLRVAGLTVLPAGNKSSEEKMARLNYISSLFHQALVKPMQLRVIVVVDYQLSGTALADGAQAYLCPQVALKLFEGGADI